ncbi:MAG: hypothetical protein J6V38_07815 [Kiritimatiellae bacterium]|nr:hypothetical protein [Kiritimatiellia bacterium]
MSIFDYVPENRAGRRAESRRLQQEAEAEAKYLARRDAAKRAAMEKIARNGITIDDLKREYERGRNESITEVSEYAMKMIYCGFALALKREFKFGAERVLRTLRAADQIILEELTTEDIIDRVSRELGITVRFDCKKGEELFDV